MLAAVLTQPRKIELREVPTPDPAPDEVVVQVKACGICQTDYKAWSGERTNVAFPSISGHEPAGIAAKVGSVVRGVQEGDEVFLSPAMYCGVCRDCRLGRNHYCTKVGCFGGDGMDIVLDGAFAQYVRVLGTVCYHKPKQVPFECAALTEPLGGCYKGLIQYGRMSLGEDVIVIGCGSIGLMLIMLARAAGAGRLIAFDTVDQRLEQARQLGASHVFNVKKLVPSPSGEAGRGALAGAVAAVDQIMPEGPNLVMEAAGSIPAVELAMALGTRHRGSRIALHGITTEGQVAVAPGRLHFLETEINSSFGITPYAMQRSIDLQARGVIDLSRIITHHFPLEKVQEAMETWHDPQRIKIIIAPNAAISA